MSTEQEDRIDKEVNAMEKATITMARFTIVIAITTVLGLIGTSIFNYYQYKEIEKTLKSSDETTKGTFERMDNTLKVYNKLADANVKSVDISDSSLIVSRMNMGLYKNMSKIENRACFVFQGIGKFKFELGDVIYASANFENLGRTPAYEVKGVVGVWPGYSGKVDSIIKTLRDGEIDDFIIKKMSPGIVGGNIMTYFDNAGGFPRIFNDTILFELITRSDNYTNGCHLYVYGCVLYNDCFGDKHFTHFFGKVNTKTGVFSPVGIYNDAK
jgi:hypothetical protein